MSLVMKEMNGTRTGDIEVGNTFTAATLWTLGFRPVDIRGTLGKKTFVFRDVPEDVARAVQLDTVRVSPMDFGLAYKKLMRLLHDTQKPSTR